MATKKIGKGRPSRQEKNQQTEQDSTQIEHWSCVPKLNKIVQILASQGQILFKCLSGYISAETQRNNAESFSKSERQDFFRDLNVYQTWLLTLLGYTQDKQFFFIGKNETGQLISDTEHQLQEYDLLSQFIEYVFFGTFRLILIYPLGEVIDHIFANPDDHKQILDWAIIKARTKSGRELLTSIQRNTDPNNETNYRVKVEEWRDQYFVPLVREQHRVQINDQENDEFQQQQLGEGKFENFRQHQIEENYLDIKEQIQLLLNELSEVIHNANQLMQ